MPNRETRKQAVKKLSNAKDKPPRKSEPGSYLAPAKDKAGTKSAGNTPNSSPLMNKSVLSRNISRRRDSIDDLKDSTNDNLDLDVVGDIDKSTNAEESPILKKRSAHAPSLTFPNSDECCPCLATGTKGSILVKCSECNQVWHSECSNLAGITLSASKKLVKWNCPRCYVSPLVSSSGSGKEDSFSEFLKITTDMKKLNEDLKENATAVDFFNTHIKHLLLNEDSFKKHSERIEKLERGITEIKEMLERQHDETLPHQDEVLKEVKFIKSHIQQSCLSEKMEEISTAIETLKEGQAHHQNLELESKQLSAIQNTLENVEKHGAEIERNSSSMKEELEWLKGILDPEEDGASSSRKDSMLDSINNMLTSMSSQLESIGEHVCPNATEQLEMDTPGVSSEVSPPMTPNTTSPHYSSPPSTYISPPCEPYEVYAEDVVPNDLKSRLLSFLDGCSGEFESVGGSRDVLYFGEHGYSYTGAYHAAKETPLVVQELMDAVRPSLPSANALINSCLITRYLNGSNHIPMHKDNEVSIDPESVIVTVSLGKERKLKFVHARGAEKELNLKDSSVYVMSRYSQDFWDHGIEAVESPQQTDVAEVADANGLEAETRFSFTFRHVAPHFKNSLVLIGDSNTKNIRFGKNLGTLGSWAPGKRLKASKIEDIPAPHEIGPYRNIILHTGINNISDDNNRRSNRSLMDLLKKKCSDIQTCYPNSKIHISLLLPTKSGYVNSRVTELNNLILDMTYNRKNTYVLDNSNLGNDRGLLPEKYGRHLYNGNPNFNDIVHLGREGIKVFCKNIKKCVSFRGNYQSLERFRGSGGNFGNAARRGAGSNISSR